MVHLAYLMLLLPLAGFLFLVTFGRRIGDPVAGWIGTAAVGGAFNATAIGPTVGMLTGAEGTS